jgi:type IV secretion system protein VirB10
MRFGLFALLFAVTSISFGQETAVQTAAPAEEKKTEGWRTMAQPASGEYRVETGTRIPLSLINSVSTKNATDGERVYLETAFPVVQNGKIVIPPGSYVAGTITHVKRPGRVKGRGELYLRFDSLTLPNGVTRDFRARVGSLDGQAPAELDKTEGKIRSEGNKGGDMRTVGESTAAGASVGAIAGSVAGSSGMGAGIGAAAGATAGLLGVMLSRGPDAILMRGSTVEMILDRPLAFSENELDFGAASGRRPIPEQQNSQPGKKQQGVPGPGRGLGRLPH